MASLLSWLGGAANRVANTLNNDVIKPIGRDVINPIQRDVVQPVQRVVQPIAPAVRMAQQVTGATLNPLGFAMNNYHTPLPGLGVSLPQIGAQLPQARQQVIGPLTRTGNVIRDYGVNSAAGLANSGAKIGMIVPNDFRAILALGTHNDAAAQSALNQAGQGLDQARQFAQFVPRSAIQLAATLATATRGLPQDQQTYQADTPLSKLLLGKEPIPALQSVYKNTPGGTVKKVVNTAGTGVMDALAVAGAAKSGEKGIAAATDAYKGNPVLSSQRGSAPIDPTKALTPDEIASGKALGLTPEQVAVEKAKMADASVPGNESALTNATAKKSKGNIPITERQKIIQENANQQTTNKVDLNPAPGNTKGAIAQAEAVATEHQSRLNRAATLASKLDTHDQRLLSEGADPSAKITPHDPRAFAKAKAAHSDAFDYSLAAKRAAGDPTLRFGGGNYHPLYLAASTAKMDELGIPQADRFQNGKFSGFRDTSREYRGYTDANQRAGLSPLNNSPVEDIKMYAGQTRTSLRNAALQTALDKSNPGETASVGMGVDANGKPYRQAAGANLPFNVSENVDKYLNNYKKAYEPTSTVGKIAMQSAEKVNAGAKRALWFGSGFHYANEAESFLGSNLFHPIVAAKGIGRAVVSLASEGGWNNVIDKARTNQVNGVSVLDGARAMGVDLPENSRLNRVTSAYSLTQAEAAMKSGIDPHSVEGVNAGRLINKIAGQKNAAVEGSDPTLTRLVSAGAAAPKWTPSQLKLVVDAFTKPGIGRFTEGGGARNAILGKRALGAGVAIGGSALLAGRLPTLNEARNQAGLNLNNPIPNIALNSKNSKDEGQVLDLPTDPAGLAVGLATNPAHFLQSRMSPALSFGTKVATNTNWNGQQLADPTQPNFIPNLIKNAAVNSVTPIGVQNFTNLTGNPNNPSIAQGFMQEAGGRLKTNPNDPKYVAGVNFGKSLSVSKQGLDRQAAQAVDRYFASGKNPATGKYDIAPNANDTKTKASNLLDNPTAIDGIIKGQQYLVDKGQTVDPLWQESKDQITKVLQYQAMPPGGADRTHWFNQNKDWYTPLADARNQFFGTLPAGDPNKPKAPIEYPSASPEVAQKQKTFFGLPDAASRAKYIAENPDLQTQLDNQVKYNNDMRTAQGYSALDTYPTATPAVQKIINTYNALPKNDGPKGGNATRSAWIKNNPQAYAQMTQYFTQASLYGAQQSLTQAQFKDTGVSQSGLKDIYNLGQYDVGKTTDANGNTFYTLGGGSNSKYATSSGKQPSASKFRLASMKAPKAPKFKIARAKAFKAPTTRKLAVSKIPSNYVNRKLA